jgi:hypothetical protein
MELDSYVTFLILVIIHDSIVFVAVSFDELVAIVSF